MGRFNFKSHTASALTVAVCVSLLTSGCGNPKETADPLPLTGQPRPADEALRGSAGATPRGSSPPLEILVENAADPFSRPDGTGYANEVVRSAFEAVGVPISLTVVPYARCKAGVLDGSAALCFSMSWDPSFQGLIKFADTPLFSVWPVYFENLARPLKARSEAELGRGIRIGTIRSYEYPSSTLKARERGALFVDGSSAAANLKKLAAGRLDATIVMANSLAGTRLWLDRANVQHLVREAFRCPSHQAAFLGASTLHPRGLWALDKYNRGIAMIEASHDLDRIRKKWGEKATPDGRVDPRSQDTTR